MRDGINLGLGDATNLGWKLAATVAGWAPEGLLDTYDTERHPVGAWVLDWTRAQIALMRSEPKVAQLRATVADLMGTRDGMTRIVNRISGVMQRVEVLNDGPLAGRLVPDITLGNGRSVRDLFAEGRFVLLNQAADSLFVDTVAPWRDRTILFAGAFTSPGADVAALLVRPDGVVAWSARPGAPPDVEGLTAALRRWAGEPASRGQDA